MTRATAILTAIFLVLAGSAAAKDNSSTPSSEDLQAACNASLNACVDACQRGYTDRPETQQRCTNQCEGSYADCIVSIPHVKSTKTKKPPSLKKAPALGN